MYRTLVPYPSNNALSSIIGTGTCAIIFAMRIAKAFRLYLHFGSEIGATFHFKKRRIKMLLDSARNVVCALVTGI
jgi:hypothetical protein